MEEAAKHYVRHAESLTVSNKGNLVVKSDWSRKTFHWNGTNFSEPEIVRLITYWNGKEWEQIPIDQAAFGENCSFRLANSIFKATRKSLFAGVLYSVMPGQQPARLACGDFTGSHRPRMAFSVPEWPCHACNPWLIYEKREAAWTLIFKNDGVCLEPQTPSGFDLMQQGPEWRHYTLEKYNWDGDGFDLVGKSAISGGVCDVANNTATVNPGRPVVKCEKPVTIRASIRMICESEPSPDRDHCLELAHSCRFNSTGDVLVYPLAAETLGRTSTEKACFRLPMTPVGPLIGELRLQPRNHVTFDIASILPGGANQFVSVELHHTNFNGVAVLKLLNEVVRELETSVLVPNGTRTYLRGDGGIVLLPEFDAIQVAPDRVRKRRSASR